MQAGAVVVVVVRVSQMHEQGLTRGDRAVMSAALVPGGPRGREAAANLRAKKLAVATAGGGGPPPRVAGGGRRRRSDARNHSQSRTRSLLLLLGAAVVADYNYGRYQYYS